MSHIPRRSRVLRVRRLSYARPRTGVISEHLLVRYRTLAAAAAEIARAATRNAYALFLPQAEQ